MDELRRVPTTTSEHLAELYGLIVALSIRIDALEQMPTVVAPKGAIRVHEVPSYDIALDDGTLVDFKTYPRKRGWLKRFLLDHDTPLFP